MHGVAGSPGVKGERGMADPIGLKGDCDAADM